MAGHNDLRDKGKEPDKKNRPVPSFTQIKDVVVNIPENVLKGLVNVGEKANICRVLVDKEIHH